MDKKYSIGLDIGTSSIGFVGVDENGWPINIKGKRAIGAHLFREGKPAAETRSFRTTRRRYNRRKWRLRLLREIFDKPITQVDPTFFARMKESSLSPRDSNYTESSKEILIPRDADGKVKYPTIYHLRHALMTENRQFDIREVYLAIHHIVKYRGHFLNSGPAKNFKSAKLDLSQDISEINVNLKTIFGIEPLEFNAEQADKLKEVLLDDSQSRSNRQKAAAKLILPIGDLDKDDAKLAKSLTNEVTKAVTGLKAKFYVITGNDVPKDQQSVWTFTIDTLDDHMDDIESSLSETGFAMISILQKLYSSVTLAGIVPEGLTLSEAMIEKYDQHADDLQLLKKYWDTKSKSDKQRLRSSYAKYIDDHKPVDEFYSELRKFLKNEDGDLAKQINAKLDIGSFLPKQRTKDNGVIPHQLQQQELDAIIKNQARYYPWLAEANPVADHQSALPYKLDELVGFRVPYYVGPMIAKDDNADPQNSKFSWMVRKQDGDITPWNFDEKVDRTASATAFINRMTTTDTYLIGEDVLPLQSIIYQRFEVLNELNKIRINGTQITLKQKQLVFNFVFKKKKSVRIKDIQDFLLSSSEVMELPEITGLADETRFNSSLSTYIDYSRLIPDAIDDPTKQEDIESIILWSTIFEDKDIFVEKLKTLPWLTEDQRQQLAQKRYRGWGRLSRKLLLELKNQQGNSVLDELWTSGKNFMQIQSDPDFAQQITEANAHNLGNKLPDKWEPGKDALKALDGVIADLYTSPQNKKALRKVLRVVQDMMTAAGHTPEKIFIEAARDETNNHDRTMGRQRQLQQLYQTEAKSIIDTTVRGELNKKIKSKASFNDRLFLYFLQGGYDMYTGKPINIDKLSMYDIDHILPQSLIKDDSLDNRVLVSAKINREKSATFASEKYMGKMLSTWQLWRNAGLISGRKFSHLTMRPDNVDKYAPGFIQRQLVETRQIIKLVIDLLNSLLADSGTEIVTIRASLSHQFRQQFNLVKIRDLNDHHHAFDAFLAAYLGTYLYKRYPKLRPYFVYGQYFKQTKNTNQIKSLNFIKALELKDNVVAEDTGEILWDKVKDLKKIEQIYDYKRLLITHESYVNSGAMFNQTIFKASDAKQNGGSKKLIPIKNNRSVPLYGGYTSQTVAYLAIIRIEIKKKPELRVMPIFTTKLQEINEAAKEGKTAELTVVKRVLTAQLAKVNVKTGEIEVPNFDIVRPKVLLDQLVIDDINGGPHRFRLGTDTYYHNSQQLYLPLKIQRLFMNADATDADYMGFYKKTLTQVNRYFNLYDVNKFRELLQKAESDFAKLPINDSDNQNKMGKRSILLQIFRGLHANATVGNLKQVGIKTDFGKLQRPSGIKLTINCKMIFESPTGLFEHIISL